MPVRSIVRSGHPEVAEQQGGGFGFHRATAIGVQGELSGGHSMLGDGVMEQRFEQGGGLGICDVPSNDAAGA